MNEKVIIRGIKTNKLSLVCLLPSIMLFIIGFILMELATLVFSRSHEYDFEWELCGNLSVFFYVLATIMLVVGVIYAIGLSKSDFTVTNTRVYGIASFGKRVDLPLDSISAVGTSFLYGIDVGTSSGRIHFKCIKNYEEIHSELSKLLMERQYTEKQKEIPSNVSTSNADELKKFKELLDSGVITQEEFEAKKKQLLGL